MKFNTKAEKLQPDNRAALLYVYGAKQECRAENETVRLLAAALEEGESFAAAQTVSDGRLHAVAVLRLNAPDRATVEKAAAEAAAWAQKQPELAVDLTDVCSHGAPMIADVLVLALGNAAYRFDRFKKEAKPAKLQDVAFHTGDNAATVAQAVHTAEAALYGINLCKDLANTAPNVCTPTYLADTAAAEARAAGIPENQITVLGKDYIRDNMPSFWGVAKGSVEEPRLIELRYFGASDQEAAPVVMVGKGLTFDSGGISLKPGEGMDEMKYDMCGAASVIGSFVAAVKAKLPLNIVALVASCENMPDGGASKPGDVVKSMSGITIENLNTDAEGRLVLCDALTYAERFKPAAVVDVATLTGACIIALGHQTSGLMANNQDLAEELLSAARQSNDKAWQLPLFPEYREQLKSNFADLQNIGGRPAGTITAAAFLSHFTENYPWAHLDIAGTAWRSGKDKGATGRPVPLLLKFLQNRSQA